MKCPKCNNDQKYNEGMYCTSCKRRFFLNPKTYGYGDAYFKFLIDKVSLKGMLYFTENQLFAVNINNHTYTKRYRVKILVVFIAVIINLLLRNTFAFFFSFGIIVILFAFFKSKPLIKLNTLKKHIKSWPERANHFKKLITEASLNENISPNIPDDVFDYGIDKIILIDNPMYVDLIVKNNWHLELKAAVISYTGYPKGIYQKAKNLAQSQSPTVYLLHDANTPPSKMTNEFLGDKSKDTEIIDLGLSKEDFDKHRSLKRFKEYYPDNLPLDVIPPERLRSLLITALTDQVHFDEILSAQDRSNDFSNFG